MIFIGNIVIIVNRCRYRQANALVKSDLDGDLAKPSSAIGMIVAALRQRRKNGTPSFTVLSCDNLPENGDKVSEGEGRAARTRYAQWRHACVQYTKKSV